MSGFENELDSNDKISEKDLDSMIKITLNKYEEEEIFWIYKELILFKNEINKEEKILDGKLKELRSFSNIKEMRQAFIQSLKKIKKYEDITQFLNTINKSERYSFFEKLKEIKNNRRLCTFILNFIKNSPNKNHYFEYYENIYFEIIYFYFVEKSSDSRVRTEIKEAIKYFNDEIKLKNKNSSKNLQDESFLNWAYVYLKRSQDDLNNIEYEPANKTNHQDLITGYLDYLLWSNLDFYENLMNKLNKAWSQKKFREANKVKKNYHLPLTKKSKEELKKLSDFKNISEANILEDAIHQIFLKEMCDENGQCKYE